MTGLALPAHACDVLIDDVRRYGHQRVETGAFLLAPRTSPDQISVVALLGEKGVERRRGLFVVTAPVVDKLFGYAEAHDLLVRSLVHSHEGSAFMSTTDKQGTIRVPGFVAAIVPGFADPSVDPKSWGWWMWAAPTWAEADAATVAGGDVDIICCDADTVTLVSAARTTAQIEAPDGEQPAASRQRTSPHWIRTLRPVLWLRRARRLS